ncbi:hypothetical protein [Halorussus aquaticus]|uniref:Secreted protein n=1 Tax=Halorussus aquaticus TaxID=2953748 RepID=A0ABD5Q017_9EURY|nr:hypothetical protein [Halorussus aquaticus]
MDIKRLAITLVLALCLVTAGSGGVSAADVGTDDCMPAQGSSVTTQSDVGTQGCTAPICGSWCYDSVAAEP